MASPHDINNTRHVCSATVLCGVPSAIKKQLQSHFNSNKNNIFTKSGQRPRKKDDEFCNKTRTKKRTLFGF